MTARTQEIQPLTAGDSSDPVHEITGTSSGPLMRLRQQGSGNALEVYNGSTVVYSVDKTGTPSAGGSSNLQVSGLAADLATNGYIVGSVVRRSLASFGAVCDGRMLTGISVSGTAVTAGSAVFTSADVGKTLCVYNADGTGIIGQGVVTAYGSGTAVTLNTSLSASSKAAVIGTDDTAAWQSAIDWAFTSYKGGRVEWDGHGTGISVLAGPQRTGTVNGTQDGTGHTYTYSGQLLMPANAVGGSQKLIEIAGTMPYAGIWSPQTLGPVDVGGTGSENQLASQSGLILLSTASSGFVVDVIPDPAGFIFYFGSFSFIQVNMSRLTIRKLCGSAAGGLNLISCAGAVLEDISVDLSDSLGVTLPPATTGALTNAGCAVVLPGDGNWGRAQLSSSQVMGYAKGVTASGSANLDEVAITHCGSGVALGVLSDRNYDYHSTHLNRVFFQNTNRHFEVLGQRHITGFVEIENPTVTFLDDPTGLITGELVVAGLDISPVRAGRIGNSGLSIRTTSNPRIPSANSPVVDTLKRTNFGSGADLGVAGFGLADGSNNGWFPVNFSCDAAGAYIPGANTGFATAVVPAPHPISRKVSATVKTSPNAGKTWIGLTTRLVDGTTGDGIRALVSNNTGAGTAGLYLVKGPVASQTQLAFTAITFSPNTDYAVDLMTQSNDQDGSAVLVTVWVAGVQKIAYVLSAAEAAAYPATGHDGVASYRSVTNDDGGSRIHDLTIKPATDLPYVSAGTATLVAGAVDVANTSITTNSRVRIDRQTSGGTLGHLSVVLLAGTKFTINSSSAADTSTVYYEIVNY
jgi:hypothetical protein